MSEKGCNLSAVDDRSLDLKNKCRLSVMHNIHYCCVLWSKCNGNA